MSEKRRTGASGGQVKVKWATTQTTLEDLFQRTSSGTDPTGKAQDLHLEHTAPAAPSLQAADPHPPTLSMRPKPSQLFPIFTKVSERLRDTAIGMNDTEVIDITDISSDIDLPTEPPLSSTHQSSPQSEFSHTAPHSPPSSPIVLDIHCRESATSLPHAETDERTHPHKKSKGLNKRTVELGDVVPLPSSCSQHVRGVQHSYTSGQAPLKRSVLPRFRPSGQGTLDFLRKWQRPDDIPLTPVDHIHRFLTPQQCEEYLGSLGCDYRESHPAFARISVHQDRVPIRHAETWTRRFRPRRANEVLGNERHAIYLRDWLSALELRSRDRKPGEPVSKGATTRENKGKCTFNRTERRGVKRPRVIRAVTRKQGNKKRRVGSDDDVNDFVVVSDTDEEQADEPFEDSEDELTFCQRTLTRLRRHDTTDVQEVYPVASNILASGINHTRSRLQEPARTDFDDKLTNTLLITGPPGCGKTAAVYACAEEMGWEIFEVYPGIGRRNGANLDHLVGDVGRNHIVQTVHGRAPTKATKLEATKSTGLGGYLAKSKAGPSTEFSFFKTGEAGTEGQPISVEADSAAHELQPLPPDQQMVSSDEESISGLCEAEARPSVGQSLVLLEEVDIIFKEDAGFWPAVIEFIECCQRPVVMTCNDPGLVPVDDLPLQKVLVFEPCPSTVAATFLQCLSLTEGCLVPHEDLVVLYESTQCIDGVVADVAVYPRTEPVRSPDLRRSITQLQMMCAGTRHGTRTAEMQQGEGHVRRSGGPISAECRAAPMGSAAERESWRQMRCHSEVMSHVDAQLCRSPGATRKGPEEEVGYVVLTTGEGGEGRDALIAAEAIRQSRGVHAFTGPMGASISDAMRARVEMVDALQGIVARPARRRSVFLDYIPWVRHMVAVDDALEAQAREGQARGRGRWTRNSVRTRHARTVGGSEGQRAVLRGTRLA